MEYGLFSIIPTKLNFTS